MTESIDPKTHTLELPGVTLHYDVRSNDASTEPPLFMLGSPMGAAGFATQAGFFTDRTVVTYDPRGVERSVKENDTEPSDPDQHAEDIARIIEALDAGPVDILASSGGAVNSLALVAKRPELVRTLVAHEPPAARELPEGAVAVAACRDIGATYQVSGMGPAMAKFIAIVMYDGPLPEDYLDQPAPDPAQFGLPTDDDGSRNDPLLGQNMVTCTTYEHDFDALRQASTRIVVGVGEESGNNFAGRAAKGVAEKLGVTPVVFAGGHDGFLGGEYGATGKPEPFAAQLRTVLDES
jgi:pimeloyl-ACP methyl ester carboxylesterase